MEKTRTFKRDFTVRSKDFTMEVITDQITGLSVVRVMENNNESFRYCVAMVDVSIEQLLVSVSDLEDAAFEHANKTMNDLAVEALVDKGFIEKEVVVYDYVRDDMPDEPYKSDD